MSFTPLTEHNFRKIKVIPETENRYKVSNHGEVYAKKRNGSSFRKLDPSVNNKGYKNFGVTTDGGVKIMFVHIEVAKAFVENTNNKPFVLHKNDIKTDNYYKNLYWGDSYDNAADRIKNGSQFRGEKSPTSKLKKDDVIEIRYIYNNDPNITQKQLFDRYGTTIANISMIVNRKIWKHI